MPTRPPLPTLRFVLMTLALLCVTAFVVALPTAAQDVAIPLPGDAPDPTDAMDGEDDGREEEWFFTMQDAVHETGLGRDAIPSIDAPQFMSVSDANLVMEDWEQVFVLDYGNPDGLARIYPQHVMLWHMVANEVIGEGQAAFSRAITYCPITGSVRGFSGEIGGFKTFFGVLGPLLNNNTLLYDRSTNSVWPQILGEAIQGPLQGEQLKTFPLIWTTFGRAKARHPDARVLSRDTGRRRSYGRDPYGAYHRDDTYYQNEQILFPVAHRDPRLPAKTRVLGLTVEDIRVAVVKSSLREPGAVNLNIGFTPVASLWDTALDAPRLFDRRVGGRPLHFRQLGEDYVDVETNSRWTPEGLAVAGRLTGARLPLLDAFDVMWFAWAAFHPETVIYRWREDPPPPSLASPIEQVPLPDRRRPDEIELKEGPSPLPRPTLPQGIPPTIITPEMALPSNATR